MTKCTIDAQATSSDQRRVLAVVDVDGVYLTGLVVTGGYAADPGELHGAGLRLQGSTVTFTSCECTDNHARQHGGCMYVAGGSTWDAFDTVFSGNSARYNGGSIFFYSGTATLVDSPFSSNTASNGDDIYMNSGSVLKIAEASAGHDSDGMKYSEIYVQEGAMVSKGCKQGEFGTLIFETVSGSCNANGAIGGYQDNFPGDNEQVMLMRAPSKTSPPPTTLLLTLLTSHSLAVRQLRR